jgi:hypothetical protein
MAKKKILWGILAISLVFVIMSIGCSSGSGGGGSGTGKTLVITGLSLKCEDIIVILFSSNEDDAVAFSYWGVDDEEIAKKSGNTYTFNLVSEFAGSKKWNGSGSYHVGLWIDPFSNDEVEYVTSQKQTFSSASTTVAFSKFTKID